MNRGAIIATLVGVGAAAGGGVATASPPLDDPDSVYEIVVRGCLAGSYPEPTILLSTSDESDELDLAQAYCAVAKDILGDAIVPMFVELNLCVAATDVELAFLDIDLALGGAITPTTAERFLRNTTLLGEAVDSLFETGQGSCVLPAG